MAIFKLSITIVVLLEMVACDNKTLPLDYCRMIAADQSFVNTNKGNRQAFESDREKRALLIKNNFDLLMEKTRRDGFPSVSASSQRIDSCKYWAVTMTMIHAAQSAPEVFFSKKYASIFNEELQKGNMERSLLQKASMITAKTIELCDDIKPTIEAATQLWEVDFSIFNEATFVNCE